MAVRFLADSALATIFVSADTICTYAQANRGQLVEIVGKVAAETDNDLEGYSVTNKPKDISPTLKENPAKRFTPLAAAPMIDFESQKNKRYLFYVDKDDYLRDVYLEEGGSWCSGKLFDKKWKCAAYSKLAAVRITKKGTENSKQQVDFIYLYYQKADDTGAIKTVNLSHTGWGEGDPDFCDPPLLGTALAAVPPQPGIQSSSTEENPVVFFQQSTLELNSSEDDGDTSDYIPYAITNKQTALAGHAYIAVVEDGKVAWCFFTSDDNSVRKIGIDSNAKWNQPTPIGLDRIPVPGSPLAAVLSEKSNKPKNIVLFYHLRDKTGQWINIYASTLTQVSTTDADSWSVSPGVSLT